ncbi:MAG: HAD hydrolase family protein [Acidobacteriota bacterium]
MTDAGDDLEEHARAIEWLICDVDGVLTDGRLFYVSGPAAQAAPAEAKTFNVRDGLGLRLAKRAGLKVALLSGRASSAVQHRASELGLDAVMLGRGDKRAALESFLETHGTTADRIATIGDDLPDLPLFGACRLAYAPANAAPEVQEASDVVLETPGGQGCVREMVEHLLKLRGEWQALVDELR